MAAASWFAFVAYQCGSNRDNPYEKQSGNRLEVVQVTNWLQLAKSYSSLHKTIY